MNFGVNGGSMAVIYQDKQKNNEIHNVSIKPTPQIDKCKVCKYFKCYYSSVPNIVELNCKKSNKTFLANQPFNCGEFKPKRRK